MSRAGFSPATSVAAPPTNNAEEFEVTQPPNDAVSALSFSPATMQQNFLIAGSWDNSVRCWEIEQSGNTVPKSIQTMSEPILDVCWNDDGTRVFMASCDKQVKCWDLGSNQTVQVAAHDAPVKTCHWICSSSYTCLVTGSWDKTLKFWDLRSSNPMMTINLPEKVYCVDVDYPMAVIGTASNCINVLKLDGKPELFKDIESNLKYEHRCIKIFRDKVKQTPTGFVLGGVDGCIGINYVQTQNSDKNFTFKCHRQTLTGAVDVQDIYAVNDVKIHPVHGTVATVGSDATFMFWDMYSHAVLKYSSTLNQPITKCCFNGNGQIFAYSTGYDWSKGHEYNNPDKKPQIFLRPCFEELKPKNN